MHSKDELAVCRGGDERWYGLYERMLAAGKSAQILGASLSEAQQVLKALGGKGVRLSANVESEAIAAEMTAAVEALRSPCSPTSNHPHITRTG
jgi:hypothetical protein